MFLKSDYTFRSVMTFQYNKEKNSSKRVHRTDLAELISDCVKCDGTGFDARTAPGGANEVETIILTVKFRIKLDLFTLRVQIFASEWVCLNKKPI